MNYLRLLLALICTTCVAQEPSAPTQPPTIIFNANSAKPPAFLYSASAKAEIKIGLKQIDQRIDVQLRILQGQGDVVSLGLGGTGDVIQVESESIVGWSIRTTESGRFLDLHLKPSTSEKATTEIPATVHIKSQHTLLPARIELTHLKPGKALGFDSQVELQTIEGSSVKIMTAEGFAPLVSSQANPRLQSTTGGKLELQIDRSSAVPPAVELADTSLMAEMHASTKSFSCQLRGTAIVTEPGARLRALSGDVALSQLPSNNDYQVVLSNSESGPIYEFFFPKTGRFSIALDFEAAVRTDANNWQQLNFIVAASAVVPATFKALGAAIEFSRDSSTLVPTRIGDQWQGYLPASGQVQLRWRHAQNTEESKPFFTTNSIIEVTVGPGLLRQDYQVNYQILQGQLKDLSMQLIGAGEILNVEGNNIVAWKVVQADTNRTLEITLNQPLAVNSQFIIHSQTALGEFPVQVPALSVQPIGAIRNSGYIRIVNTGSVSVEPTELRGLTQLAPEQFPGAAIQSRQLFVYRYPASDYSFTLVADRVQPEVNVTELTVYQLSEADRVIAADIELDIREAAVREWTISVPEDYSVVSVTGSNVADYMAAADAQAGSRDLKILFSQEVEGRQLVNIRLEKNEAAASGTWSLPRIAFPDAKSVRGDIGIVTAPGFRATIASTELLVEKPLSYFPRSVANLQQAFRMREPNWQATMQIEKLEQSVQADTFHLLSLSQGTVYGSALLNYSVTGSPVSEWRVMVPAALANVTVDGSSIRTWRREGDTLIVSLQQAILGTYTLLITYEDKPNVADGSFQAGQIAPLSVQGDRGYIEVVSPVQVEVAALQVPGQLLTLDPLELPPEFRLLSTAPTLGTWQYTQRPFDLRLKVNWFTPGSTATQVVEFSEANSHVSPDGEVVTDLLYYVKSRGQRTLKLQLPGAPVRLWSVSVNGNPVTARTSGDDTLIPLPGTSDPNEPIEVALRLGRPAATTDRASLQLPTVFAPILKTQWNLLPDENRVLVSRGGSVEPTQPNMGHNGFHWLAGTGLLPLALLAGLALAATLVSADSLKLVVIIIAIFAAAGTSVLAFDQTSKPTSLQLDLPVLASGENIQLEVDNLPQWRAFIIWPGVWTALIGLVLFALSFRIPKLGGLIRIGGWALLAGGVLVQINGAPWFFILVAISIAVSQLLPVVSRLNANSKHAAKGVDVSKNDPPPTPGEGGSIVTASIVFLLSSLTFVSSTNSALAVEDPVAGTVVAAVKQVDNSAADGILPARSLTQKWTISTSQQRLTATAEMLISGRPGDRFLLLSAPAVLTEFQGPGLQLNKLELSDQRVSYVVTIPASENESANNDNTTQPSPLQEFTIKFQYQLEAVQPASGITVLTGQAALQQIELDHDQPNREVECTAAARIEAIKDSRTAESTHARLWLGPAPATIVLRPPTRDVTSEQTQFFVESADLYTPWPGVIDGKHQLKIRTSQGRVTKLDIAVPGDLTVSAVSGAADSWQFDADQNRLRLNIAPGTPSDFTVTIETQRSLDALPADAELSPMRVEGASSSVGLIGLAFGSEAQPESVQTDSLSPVDLKDFDASLVNPQTALHKVLRYGPTGGKLAVRVSPVAPEVRVTSKQVISFGDERIVLGINFETEITRTGLFQLSFRLPAGFEVESLTGEALHHWSELSDDNGRQIVLHLKGKTLGAHKFALTLAGNTPSDAQQWSVPRFELNESTRQAGELAVQPATGIRLRTVGRQNVSEADPRTLGAQGQGALAYRLLQTNWTIQLGIEKLDPWITGQVLHELTLREGQTRTKLFAEFNIENAAVRSLQIKLPALGEDEAKSVHASGEAVSDLVKGSAADDVWELRFKRRIIGPVKFQIEYQKRSERADNNESLQPSSFPDSRQLAYYFAVRSGGRLEIEPGTLTQGWQRADWSSLPQSLRDVGNRNAPVLTMRAIDPTTPLSLKVQRHSLADALKLRVTSTMLTTILSPSGDQLTAVDVTIEVIQRSNLIAQLPPESELFSIFVNGESVHSIREQDQVNAWQFSILPGMNDRTAQVRLVYATSGVALSELDLVSPQLNVPLENITWKVIAPTGFQLTDEDGNMELAHWDIAPKMDRQTYLKDMQGKRQRQAEQAAELLRQANQLLQAGQQSKAQWAFGNVANRYALDAASNEDARVQLENLQTQQAVVGLNTRRQRLFLDNPGDEPAANNQQLLQAADSNPVLRQEQLSYRPGDLSQLLAGNSKEELTNLQRIAGRLVHHQRTTEPAPQAIVINLPEDGTIYTFRRSVQVTENAPLELSLEFQAPSQLPTWKWGLLASLVAALAIGLVIKRRG